MALHGRGQPLDLTSSGRERVRDRLTAGRRLSRRRCRRSYRCRPPGSSASWRRLRRRLRSCLRRRRRGRLRRRLRSCLRRRLRRRRRRGAGARRRRIGGVGVGRGLALRLLRMLLGVDRQRQLGIGAPDLGGERAAGDGTAVVLGQHRDQPVREPNPDRRRELRRPADKPGVALVGRRAGLADHVDARDLCRLAGARGHDAPQQALDRRGGRGRNHPLAANAGADVALIVALGVRADDLGDPDRTPVRGAELRIEHPRAAVGHRLVGVRHLERGDAHLEPADDHRRVGRDRGDDPHRLGHLRDPLGADALGQSKLGEHAVVRLGGRLRDRRRARYSWSKLVTW